MPDIEPVQACRACLYDSRHPFGLTFDATGLCSGCATHAEKTSLDWASRVEGLSRLLAPYRGRKGNYDCVIPIRGTPEYFQVLDIVKNQLGLNPLLVAFNSQFNSAAGIENIDLIRDTFDCDILLKTTSPLTYRKLIRETLSRFGSVHWPYLAGHTVWPVRVAVQHNIPLIIWPLHQPTEQAGMFSYLEENEMTRRSRHEHDLLGREPLGLRVGDGARVGGLEDVDVAGLEGGHALAAVGDRLDRELVEVGQLDAVVVLLPVARVSLQHDSVVGHVLGEGERARADGVVLVLSAVLRRGGRRLDVARGACERVGEGDAGRGQVEHHGQSVRAVGRVHRGDDLREIQA